MKTAILIAEAVLLAGCGLCPHAREQARVAKAMRALEQADSLQDFLDVELERSVGRYDIDEAVIAQKRRQWYTENHPDLSPEMKRIILAGECRVGMPKDHLYASKGVPWGIERTVTAGTVYEQVVYGPRYHYSYFYFENGILTRWQD